MHIVYVAKDQFGRCSRGSRFGHGYVSGNHPRDDIERLKKYIFYLGIFCCVFNVAQYMYTRIII